jgi:hypothetical protein
VSGSRCQVPGAGPATSVSTRRGWRLYACLFTCRRGVGDDDKARRHVGCSCRHVGECVVVRVHVLILDVLVIVLLHANILVLVLVHLPVGSVHVHFVLWRKGGGGAGRRHHPMNIYATRSPLSLPPSLILLHVQDEPGAGPLLPPRHPPRRMSSGSLLARAPTAASEQRAIVPCGRLPDRTKMRPERPLRKGPSCRGAGVGSRAATHRRGARAGATSLCAATMRRVASSMGAGASGGCGCAGMPRHRRSSSLQQLHAAAQAAA